MGLLGGSPPPWCPRSWVPRMCTEVRVWGGHSSESFQKEILPLRPGSGMGAFPLHGPGPHPLPSAASAVTWPQTHAARGHPCSDGSVRRAVPLPGSLCSGT